MDIEELQTAIDDDLKDSRLPCIVIAYAGTPIIGHVDDITAMQKICTKNNIWLHIEGSNLATLVLYSVPTSINAAKTGDSITLNLSSWFGIPSIPQIVIFKEQSTDDMQMTGLLQSTNKSKLGCLGLWMCLQEMGHDNMVERVQRAVTLSNYLAESLNKMNHIRHLSKRIKEEVKDKNISSFGDVAKHYVTKAYNALVTFEIENPTIVFQYYIDLKETKFGKLKTEKFTEEEETDYYAYLNSLNIWLVETIKRDINKVFLSSVEIDNAGSCIRFSSLETAHALGTEISDIDKLLKCLEQQIPILNATIEMRDEFQNVICEQDNLKMIKIAKWAGLGAIRFVPDGYLNREWSDEDIKNINALNISLVHELKSKDTAFSLGFDENQIACVRFGLVTNSTDLEELIGLVVMKGKEVEEASRYLEVMAGVVKQGIEKAEHQLLEEQQEKLAAEGVLRQVPIVSGIVNWLSPPPKQGGKGRNFLLNSNKIVSSEPLYKYKMQVQEETVLPDSNHAQPYKSVLKASKRRSDGTENISVENLNINVTSGENATEATDGEVNVEANAETK